MPDNSTQQVSQPVTMEQVLAQNEYLTATVDVLQSQLAEATNKLTQAQVSATVFRSKMNMLGQRVNELQEQLAATRAAVPPSGESAAPIGAVATPLGNAQVEPEAPKESESDPEPSASTGVPLLNGLDAAQ